MSSPVPRQRLAPPDRGPSASRPDRFPAGSRPSRSTASSSRAALSSSFPSVYRCISRDRLALVRAGIRLRFAVRRYAAVARERPAAVGRRAATADARVDGRPLILGVHGPAAAGRGRIVPLHAHALVGGAREARRGLRGRLLPSRMESRGRPVDEHCRRLLDADRGDRGRAWRPCAHQRPGRAGDAGGRRRRRGVRPRGNFAHARRSWPRPPMSTLRHSSRAFLEETAKALAAIPYGPYVLGGFLTNETGTRAVGRHLRRSQRRSARSESCSTRAMRCGCDGRREPGGSMTVAAAADAARSLAGLSDDEVAERYRADLVDLFPALDGAIVETKIVRWERGLPHPTVGRAKLQPAFDPPTCRPSSSRATTSARGTPRPQPRRRRPPPRELGQSSSDRRRAPRRAASETSATRMLGARLLAPRRRASSCRTGRRPRACSAPVAAASRTRSSLIAATALLHPHLRAARAAAQTLVAVPAPPPRRGPRPGMFLRMSRGCSYHAVVARRGSKSRGRRPSVFYLLGRHELLLLPPALQQVLRVVHDAELRSRSP